MALLARSHWAHDCFMNRIHDGSAELTFADCASVFVPAERVLFTMTDDGEGALWIGPGPMPNMTEIETALESGPFNLTSEGMMQSCKPLRWIVREVTSSLCEMLVLFEPDCGDAEATLGESCPSSESTS